MGKGGGGGGGGAPPPPTPPANFRQGDWFCPACAAHNFASKQQCFKCGMPKPPELGKGMPGMGFGGGGGGKGGHMGGVAMPDEAPKLFPSVYVSDIPRSWDTQTLQMMIDDDEVVQIKLLPSKLDAETCCAMVRFRSKEAAEGAVARLKGLPVTTAQNSATGATKYLGARIANAPAKLPGQRWAMAKRMMGHPAGWQGPSSSSSSDSDSSSSSSSSSSEKKKKKKKKKE